MFPYKYFTDNNENELQEFSKQVIKLKKKIDIQHKLIQTPFWMSR